ncbi:MAG TPA: glycoside hydrolase family 2 TIM barrel-domain containing protein [Planctomycetota bacterium]|jgi:hypothetical protein
MKTHSLAFIALVFGAIFVQPSARAAEGAAPVEAAAVRTLSGTWLLATDPGNKGRDERWFEKARPEAKEAAVPGVIQQVFPGYHGVAWYWNTFVVKAATGQAGQPAPQRHLLRFGAVDYLADVWVNGTHVGSYEGGETPFEFDVTAALKFDVENVLAVRVINPGNTPIDGVALNQTPHRNKVVSPRCGSSFDYGGIMYSVELRRVPAVYVSDVFVRPDVKSGSIGTTISVRNSGDKSVAATIELNVATSAGGDVVQAIEQKVELPAGESSHELALTVSQPRLWNLDDPYLYRVTAKVSAPSPLTPLPRGGEGDRSAGAAHQQSVRCGFRDLRVVDGYFQLNGKRIFLKSTHTGNHIPMGQVAPVIADYVRRDAIYAKASGFNTIRFISGMAYPEQLDFCDELGLMVYEECLAGWCLENSPKMGERFDRATSDMVRRDRNHPSVTIWGLMNETPDGPVFRQAVSFLPKLRKLDPTRLVLLHSGRWDGDPKVGSVSNPGGTQWEATWGVEGPDAPKTGMKWGGYVDRAGDAHVYPGTPHTPQTVKFIRELGRDTKPVFLSEYGIGSLMNVIKEWRGFEQAGARPDLEDAAMVRAQSQAFMADWKRLGFDDVYAFPEDLLRESQRLHSRQRTLGFDLVRSNPKLCGYNLTGMLDHAITGEGLWTFWRQWKPATFDAVADGWSPLRWCLFADPQHGYSGKEITVEAVLASEDALKPGEYPVRCRITGPAGVAWEKAATVKIPDPAPFAIPAIRETVKLEGPAGQYTFAANLESGGAPTGGRLTFYLTAPDSLPKLIGEVALWGIDKKTEDWLTARGLTCRQFNAEAPAQRELILVGKPDGEKSPAVWEALTQRLAKGSTIVFVSAHPFRHGKAGMNWLPLKNKGRCISFNDWLYHKECVTRRHAVFQGLQGPGIMDWDYYGPVVPHEVFEGQDTPDDTMVASFVTGYYDYPNGYGCGLLMAAYKSGEGRFILSTPYILENLGTHPAADRLLVNLIRYAQ